MQPIPSKVSIPPKLSIPVKLEAKQVQSHDPIANPIICTEKDLKPYTSLRGTFWVHYNYIPAKVVPKCNESITYATHGEFLFLDNIVPLVTHWNGPISFALFAPGTDYFEALNVISYYRWYCESMLREYRLL